VRAMVLERARESLVEHVLPDPEPGPGELRLVVSACGVCRTDLHIVDGELDRPKLPLVPGHQIVGVVDRVGDGVEDVAPGDRVGVPWLGWTCGECEACRRGEENLCDRARFTGYDRDGGYAELAVADARFAFPVPPGYSDRDAAPLLCAGLIGYRAYRMACAWPRREGAASVGGGIRRLGFYGFGSAAHLVAQIARHEGREVYAFTRRGDRAGQEFARAQGATWAGAGDEKPPAPLDAALLFAPAGELVPAALAAVRKGGVVVCAGIHMSDIPALPYSLLWGERGLRSVANLTRRDGEELLALAPRVPLRPQVVTFPLARANEALAALRDGCIEGSAVLLP
jgi:propanol-preferring alcohol dehydrogenase